MDVEVDKVAAEAGKVEEVEEVEEANAGDEEADEEDVAIAGVLSSPSLRPLLGVSFGAAVWTPWAMRMRVLVCASGVRARFPWWCQACMQVPVSKVVLCVVCCGIDGLLWLVGVVAFLGRVRFAAGDAGVLLEVVDAAEEGPLNPRHVLLCEVVEVFSRGVLGPV